MLWRIHLLLQLSLPLHAVWSVFNIRSTLGKFSSETESRTLFKLDIDWFTSNWRTRLWFTWNRKEIKLPQILTMAMLSSKVTNLIFAVVVLVSSLLQVMLTVEGAYVSIGNGLKPVSELKVHCRKSNQDLGVRVVHSEQQYSVNIAKEYLGSYLCVFEAAGKRTATFDVLNSRCNCNSYYGCQWVAKSEGFYCNYDFIRRWGWAADPATLQPSPCPVYNKLTGRKL